jgi:hypothetical protein
VLFFRSDAPAGFFAAVREVAGAPLGVRTERALAIPLLGVDGAAPVPDLLGPGEGDVAPPAGELRPGVCDEVGVFLGIVAIVRPCYGMLV